MNRLWVRLSLAFAIVMVVSVGLAVVLVNRELDTGFRRYLSHNQIAPELVDGLAAYYQRQGSWDGVDAAFTALSAAPGGGAGRRRGASRFLLADEQGNVIYDASGQYDASRLSSWERTAALPVQVEGQTVGYLYATTPGREGLNAQDQAFLDQVQRSLLQAGVIGAILGILLSLLLARGLSAPLSRLAAAARRISQGNLEHRVPEGGSEEIADVARAFNEMAADLQEAEVLRRNLVADIAHELRTPLTVIQGNLQAILDGVYPLSNQEIALIYDETMVLHRLINDLHQLTRADAGQLNLHIVPTEVAPIVESAVALFEGWADSKHISLDSLLPPLLPTVMADPDRLRQVLSNLVSNALHHTPETGTVQIAAAPVTDRTGKPSVRITVTDTGPGIPPDQVPRVFDRFWRADLSRSRDLGGSGLGLTIAKKLVEAQGGQIGVESVVDQGSQFWFELPATEPSAST